MAEEVKQQEKKSDAGKTLATIFKFALGIAFLVFGAWAVHRGWHHFMTVLKGTIGWFCILAGLITLAIAKD
jgi:fatty acid desaturase